MSKCSSYTYRIVVFLLLGSLLIIAVPSTLHGQTTIASSRNGEIAVEPTLPEPETPERKEMPKETLASSPQQADLSSSSSEAPVSEKVGFYGLQYFGHAGRISLLMGVRPQVGWLSLDGRKDSEVHPLPIGIKQVARDPRTGRYFVLGEDGLAIVATNDSLVERVNPDPRLPRSRPLSLAFDGLRDRVVVLSEGIETNYIEVYYPRQRHWRRLSSVSPAEGPELIAFCKNQKRIFLLSNKTLRRFDSKGVLENETSLERGVLKEAPQFFCSEGRLFVLQYYSAEYDSERRLRKEIYEIKPDSGSVSELLAKPSKNPMLETIWPGMKNGPTSFKPATAVCDNEGSSSQYLTPRNLLEKQNPDLHVISTYGGTPDNDDVTVTIPENSQPIVLLLASQTPITWNVLAKNKRNIKEIFVVGNPKQRLRGVVEAFRVNRLPDALSLAHAWEHERDSEKMFPEFIKSVRRFTRMRERSFQGCYRGKSFAIP